MQINLKIGVGDLIFGMLQNDVKLLLGEPNTIFNDEDNNIIWIYNDYKLRLTFYEDENFKLGYIKSTNKDVNLFSEKIIGQKWQFVESLLISKNIKNIEKEQFDSLTNYFNESNWFIIQVEYEEVIGIELGVTFTQNDEADFKFKPLKK